MSGTLDFTFTKDLLVDLAAIHGRDTVKENVMSIAESLIDDFMNDPETQKAIDQEIEKRNKENAEILNTNE